ncbi:MAG: 30S ribosomal protein S13 [Bacteroidales bacterium]|nr:30S ribosomal protein S13 [Bacteroidales bacterium]MCF8327142.1 30S ribosomal protein S13 [Bacteroidales bacterium]
MARIAGVDLPKDKHGNVGLTYVYGISHSTANKVLDDLKIARNKKVSEWDDEDLTKIRNYVNDNLTVEGSLRSQVQMNIKRLMDIGCYRGIRHRVGLPLNGQKTKNNARTRKGRKKTVANKKKAVK